jgi:hypothetical protein
VVVCSCCSSNNNVASIGNSSTYITVVVLVSTVTAGLVSVVALTTASSNVPVAVRNLVCFGLRVKTTCNGNEYQENFLWVKRGWRVRLNTSQSYVSRLSRKCGNFDVSQPYRPSGPVTGIVLFFT